MKFKDVYDKFGDDEYLNFDAVTIKLSQRADIHAFIILDRLYPNDRDMISCAEHDEIWLEIDPNKLDNLSEEQMIELIRCGVRYDWETDSLAMFV